MGRAVVANSHAGADRSGSNTTRLHPSHPRAWSQRGDRAELEANALAGVVLSHPRLTGLVPSGGGANRGSGAMPLAAGTRSYFEPRFGRDFSRVRVRTGAEAAAATHRLGARAYIVGEEIMWSGPAQPDSPLSRSLMAHELAHVAAGHTAAAPGTAFRDEPSLPTAQQQQDINRVFNPQQSLGPDVPPVTDGAGFATALKARAAELREQRFPAAHDVQVSPVSLSTGDLADVTKVAANRVRKEFQTVLAPGIDLEALRSGVKYIPTDPGTAPTPDEAVLSAERLNDLDKATVDTNVLGDGPSTTNGKCLEIIERFHVLLGDRDLVLYEDTLKAIVSDAPAKWRTIALSMRGWDSSSMPPVLQRHIKPQGGEAEATTRRRGRWLNLGTSIHELLHASTHPDFRTAMYETENRRLGSEGFTEHFTRQVYASIVSDAAGDPVLRLSIEGAPGPPPITPPPRTAYQDYFDTVESIAETLGGNEENLRQAYFRGRVEYIGFGRWNELQRDLRRHQLGAAILFRASGTGQVGNPYVRADWGYLILGRTGDVQLDLRAGAGITYVSEGERLGFGPQISGTVRGGQLFLTGGVLLQGSASLAGGANDPRLEAVFKIEAGAHIGRFHVGPTLEVLVPITETDAAKRTAQVFAGIGVSFVLGK